MTRGLSAGMTSVLALPNWHLPSKANCFLTLSQYIPPLNFESEAARRVVRSLPTIFSRSPRSADSCAGERRLGALVRAAGVAAELAFASPTLIAEVTLKDAHTAFSVSTCADGPMHSTSACSPFVTRLNHITL